MESFTKVVRIGTVKPEYAKSPYSVFVKIDWDGRKLRIAGVEGPTSGGNARGGCGQIDMHEWPVKTYAPGWDAAMVGKLRDIWGRWHLNDMHAECEHQRARGESWQTHPEAVCPDCGYRLGSGWRHEDVPQAVTEWLKGLPDADRQPAWI